MGLHRTMTLTHSLAILLLLTFEFSSTVFGLRTTFLEKMNVNDCVYTYSSDYKYSTKTYFLSLISSNF